MGNNIEGKVVVITGASSGLGESTARLLSAQGASVVLGARRGDRLQSLAEMVKRRSAVLCPTEEKPAGGFSCRPNHCGPLNY